MKILVTGCAGFIGSHLVERLCRDGHQVVGIDYFSDYYPLKRKEKHLQEILKDDKFQLIEGNLIEINLDELLEGVEIVFHQAAQAGIRKSWGKNFQIYVNDNILSTQILLEALKNKKINKLVFASSSSVYGDTDDLPMRENSPLSPISPYGLTKLSSEKLTLLYWKNYGIPVVCLRYFTVYGPRQRPDMAFSRFIKATLEDTEIYIYGDGEQTRDFTYIDDIVEANVTASKIQKSGQVFNLGGGSRASINKVLTIISEISQKQLNINYEDVQPGDVKHTWADTKLAKEYLNFNPQTSLKDGLKKQYQWSLQNQDVL